MTKTRIRMATLDDAARLQEIYTPYVEETNISFDVVVPTVEEFRGSMQEILNEFPYLVYEKDGQIYGYAYAHKCFVRAAYSWDAEMTVYLAHGEHGRGVGSALYGALIEFLEALEYKNLYAVITAENMESRRFHEKNGFRLFAIFRKTGWKHGTWLDVAWYERQLGTLEDAPTPTRSIRSLSQDFIDETCARFTELLRQ
ncbi:MAG: GNAT family N-acetyltransferase [Thermoguttaceae bacterium]